LSLITASDGTFLLGITPITEATCNTPVQYSEYSIFFIAGGTGQFRADFGIFPFTAPALLFATPMQLLHLDNCKQLSGIMLQFHGDFYCIEYHREEVACNGLLFNNIYIDPLVKLADKEATQFQTLLNDLAEEAAQAAPVEMVLRSYLQLFLAKASAAKRKAIANDTDRPDRDDKMEQFRQLLDKHYLTLHKPADYASLLAISPDHFTKSCNRYYKKTPSQMIQERLILEAKKQLHLTRKSIKEIAFALHFEDEFYFSRFFKKMTKVSPQTFRDKTGISIVADLSM